MRRALMFIPLLLVVGVLAWEFIPIQVKVWDGSFKLTVHVSSNAESIRSVSCEAFFRRQEAETALEHLLPPEPSWSVVADPFDGQPLSLNVAVSGRDSPWGRELQRYQHRYLVVIAQLKDGQRIGKVVEIPDSRLQRDVSVSLP